MKCIRNIFAVTIVLLIVAAPVVTKADYNEEFKFALYNYSSRQANVGGTNTKPNDGDTYAYVRAISSGSNLAMQGAQVNVRVRDSNDNYATDYDTVTTYNYTYMLPYLPYKAVGGAEYRLYGNVEVTSAFPVALHGYWCP